jgi:glycerol-3-phosphate dehydrogenase subunit B
MSNSEIITCDLTVIGAGMAGMAATLYAVNRGIRTIQIGRSGESVFASGLFDLLGIHPISASQRWDDPWAGIDALVHDIPNHPYARVTKKEIEDAFTELLTFLKNEDHPYSRYADRNVEIPTALGTVKTTYCVPDTMWGAVKALAEKRNCLIVSFNGLKGFSARMIAGVLHERWPGLRAVRIPFPETERLSEVYPEFMANALVTSENRKKLAEALRPHIKDAQIIGMPAILGLYRCQKVIADLEALLGVSIFEIPTMPPAVTGLRLKEAFDQGLRSKRENYFPQQQVLKARQKANGDFEIIIGNSMMEQTVVSKGVILATGRFIGGGLQADRKRIRETLFDLPVCQPEKRTQWHRENLLDKRGHPINMAGLETDDEFRPTDRDGTPVYDLLFAVGSVLAHQDWKRMKCGSGLAIATAYTAVRAFTHRCGL